MNGPPTILVVDDHRSNLTPAIVEPFGCALLHADGAGEALGLCVGHDPVAVLVDLDARGFDPCALAALIREGGATRHIPLLFLASSAQAFADRLHGRMPGPGPCDWLEKPLDAFLLGSKLSLSLELRRLREQARSGLLRSQAVEEAQRLAAAVFETLDEGVLVTDAGNRIVSVNPAFSAITGYAEREVLGRNPSMLSSRTLQPGVFESMWEALNGAGSWQGEIWNRRKNGELYVESLAVKVVRDSVGAVTHHVVVFSDITKEKKSAELIWQQANFDPLTKLANRHMLLDRLQQGVMKARRDKLPLALMIVDLDHFKEVNDTLGHDKGDVLLVEAAGRIGECVRGSDTVARLGGDEFVILLSSLDDLGCVERIAKQINVSLRAPFQLGAEHAFVSASIGIAFYPADANEADELLKHADQAMFVSKRAGRNRYGYFAPEMQHAAQARRRINNDLRVALEGKQFVVHYQPIVELRSGAIFKAEALIRWLHPVRGLISPAEFIPLAEETGLINEIGDWVFKEAARQVQRLRAAHHPSFQISVNKSPVQFRKDGGPYKAWLRFLKELELDGQSMVIEITEGLLMNVESNVTEKLNAFHEAGIQVSLDDFGTGYSSLAYLKKFDIDFLKIDQSFVNNMERDPDSLALCESIILMAHKLGLQVIAEGVETEEQRILLCNAGCDFAQGFLFSRPVASAEFEAFLARIREHGI